MAGTSIAVRLAPASLARIDGLIPGARPTATTAACVCLARPPANPCGQSAVARVAAASNAWIRCPTAMSWRSPGKRLIPAPSPRPCPAAAGEGEAAHDVRKRPKPPSPRLREEGCVRGLTLSHKAHRLDFGAQIALSTDLHSAVSRGTPGPTCGAPTTGALDCLPVDGSAPSK